MLEIPVIGKDGSEVGRVRLDEKQMGSRPRTRLLHDYVVMYEANQRVGSASTLTKSEVAGSGKKPWKQKHTGRARAGMKRPPLWRHGGVAHGPKPRDFGYKIPRKARQLALRNALLAKILDGEVSVLDSIELPEIKTRLVADIIAAVGVKSDFLLILPEPNEKVWKSARNIRGAVVQAADTVNAYDILRARRVVIVKEALARLCPVGQAGEGAETDAEDDAQLLAEDTE
ncbi:MAG TPA: 50S ribosomal protein L4 [Candidatus Brocadiia bacterium]|nr:50S ribosomal protein L4 [Candidatus Brocadiia bacterium]